MGEFGVGEFVTTADTSRTSVIVALGSNLGDSTRILREAMDRLAEWSVDGIERSSLWRTRPVDCPPGSPGFVNAVVRLRSRPEETPYSMLAKLQALEREFGREPKRVINEPRSLDLDLIAWGDLELRTPELIVPHPRAYQRRFVLVPLAEFARDWTLPGQSLTVGQLLEGLKGEESVERLP